MLALPPVCYRHFTSKRKFGVELEVGDAMSQSRLASIIGTVTPRKVSVTGWSQTAGNDYWHVKTDSTCGPLGKGKDDGGYEIASYVATGYKDIVDISDVARALTFFDVKVNNNCGLHIHVDISDFAPARAGVMLMNWLQIEQWFRQMVPDRRKTNRYCKFLSVAKSKKYRLDTKYDPIDVFNLLKPTNLGIHENPQKKVALNLVNFCTYLRNKNCKYSVHRPTVEFRFPEGTLNGDDIGKWILLFLMFVDNAMALPEKLAPEESIDKFLCVVGLQAPDKFLILDKILHELKIWIFERIITFGTKKYVDQALEKYEICSC